MLRLFVRTVVAASLLFATAANAAYPERAVTLVVPFAAGGITDVLARLTAERLQGALKQTFIVENKPGAAGVIAADHVAKAAPDGYTLLFTPIFQITMAPFTNKVNFDPVKDFKPIAAVGATPFVITVAGTFPANTLAEFIDYVKKQPNKITFASAGNGSLTHVSSVVFLKSAGLEMVHVPYRGVGPAFNDLLAGHVAMLSASPVELKPFLETNRVKPLAVTSAQRSKQLPNVPAISETVKHSPPVVTYNGLLAPGRTPQAIVDTLSKELMAAEKSPEFRERLSKIGVESVENTPAQFAKMIADDTEQWRGIVTDLNLKPE
jgi:tripartite-type tricarboxylate transporter receptor subunit TctC